jgi:type I restriction enzyme S subunit
MKRLPAYPAYRGCRIDFLGRIPETWSTTRIANIFEERKVFNHPDELLLSIDRYRGIIKQSDTGRKVRAPKDRAAYKLIEEGQLGYNILNAFMGSVGVSRYRGIVSPAYAVARLRKPQEPFYFHYLLRTELYQRQFNRFSYGIMYERNRLYYDRFKVIPIPVPPKEDQEKIVAYLRAQDAHTARLLKAKRDLIALLNEQKLRIIDQAVTHGLDTSVSTKPSNIEWQGPIPDHWVVKPLKRWVRLNARTLGEITDPDFLFRYLDIGAVTTGRLAKELEILRFSDAPSRARRILRRGDTVISTVRTYLKAIWFVNEDAEDLIASTGFAVLTPGLGVEPEYLGYLVQSSAFVNRVTANSIGIAYPAIAETVLGRFPVALPPTLEEQRAVIDHIKTASEPLDHAIEQAFTEIKLVHEYRDRQIADVVMGQIDVRGWQPGPEDLITEEDLTALGDVDDNGTTEEETNGDDGHN